MKRIIIFGLFFCLIILSSCNVEVSNTSSTSTQTNIISLPTEETEIVVNDIFPLTVADAKSVKKELLIKDENLSMVVVIEGYSSESMNLDFFIPYNKYTQISISITNDSNQKYYQNLRNGCHGITPSHNHEIIIDVKNDEGDKLQLSSNGYSHTEMMDYWTIDINETYRWDIRVAPGRLVEGKDYELKCDGSGYSCGIVFCDKSSFKDGVSHFVGAISFPYNTSENYEGINEYKLFVDIDLVVGFVNV